MTLPAQPDFCWPLDPGCLGSDWDAMPDDVHDRAAALAVATLRRFTLERVGGCPVTIRPCAQGHAQRRYGGSARGWSPRLYGGVWVNCGCYEACVCGATCEIKMPGFVGPVSRVQVGAVDLALTDLKVADDSKLVWRGTGDCPFPKRQNMDAALGQPNTFGITYLPAHPVDGMAAWAAGSLAAEIAKACTGNTSCKLPKNVVSLIRQGVTMTMVPGTFPGNKTGLREVDAWVALWNPRNATFKTTVWSPDMPEFRIERGVQ